MPSSQRQSQIKHQGPLFMNYLLVAFQEGNNRALNQCWTLTPSSKIDSTGETHPRTRFPGLFLNSVSLLLLLSDFTCILKFKEAGLTQMRKMRPAQAERTYHVNGDSTVVSCPV